MGNDHHVALLRGINVGTAKRVAMADLRRLVQDLGFTDVRTLLNSGNVVFRATPAAGRTAATRIARGMADKLGVSARVIVITAKDLAAIVAKNPLLPRAPDHSRLLVAVFADAQARAAMIELSRQDWTPGTCQVGPQAAYLWCPEGVSKSPLAAAVAKALGDGVTSRNWATMLKLQALVDGNA